MDRKLTREEALKIAREIQERAEKERLEQVEREAKQGPPIPD